MCQNECCAYRLKFIKFALKVWEYWIFFFLFPMKVTCLYKILLAPNVFFSSFHITWMRVFWFHEVILDIKFCLWNAWSQIKVQVLIARRSNNDLFKQLRCSQTLIYVYRPWQTWEWYLVLGFPNYFCHTIIRIIRWVSLNKCMLPFS